MPGNTTPAGSPDTQEEQTNCKPGTFYVFASIVLKNNNM